MTEIMLIMISIFWIPVALALLGKAEPKGAGLMGIVVGGGIIISCFVNAIVFGDTVTGGLVVPYGLLYIIIGYSLMAGLSDLRSAGMVSLATAFLSAIYAIIWFVGTPLIPAAPYFGFAAVGYTIITFMIFLLGFGKISAKIVGWSLLIWVPFGLWIPAFGLLVLGELPF
ncbi:hypothetical protein M1M93_00725 [Thermodesulfovibrionales bacterium]|nr:hypothetical protein [Thermodesulfovibrionales bacterium]